MFCSLQQRFEERQANWRGKAASVSSADNKRKSKRENRNSAKRNPVTERARLKSEAAAANAVLSTSNVAPIGRLAFRGTTRAQRAFEAQATGAPLRFRLCATRLTYELARIGKERLREKQDCPAESPGGTFKPTSTAKNGGCAEARGLRGRGE